MAERRVPLSKFTTLRLGGPARTFLRATSEPMLIDAVGTADSTGEPVLILGGGSNLVVADDGFAGTVIRIETTGLSVEEDDCSGATVTVAAGHEWDGLVAHAVGQDWVGIEALSGIPGSVGATPIQNVGAYGQEVASTIASVRCWDRTGQRIITFAAAECGFGYRSSRFKREPGRFVVLTVTFQLALGDLGAPVGYADLARAVGVEIGGRARTAEIREAVLGLRRGKGMVLEGADHDTWSAGSFFTNPVLDVDAAARLPEAAPRWVQNDGTIKTSAAWLIEQAGFSKGYGNTTVSVSTKHSLALTNRGGATTADLVALAREIQSGVTTAFGVRLVNEPVLVGCELEDRVADSA